MAIHTKSKEELIKDVEVLQNRLNELEQLERDLKSKSRKQDMMLEVVRAINRIFQETFACGSEVDVAKVCLDVVEKFTGSQFGFIGEVNPTGRFDTIAISDPGWGACRMPQSEAVMQITNMDIRGIWGKVIKDRKSCIINDPMHHPERSGIPDGHPALTSFLGVPLRQGEEVVGMIALANKEGGYIDDDVEGVESISIALSEAMRSKRAEQSIRRLAQEIMDMSTPVIQLWEGIVAAPLIGTLDSSRTQQFMEALLGAITETNSPIALIDITGVPTIDTQTGQHLIEAITATKLLGAEVILTGVRPAIAQTLVHLGIDMSGFKTKSSLAAGFTEGLIIMNRRIVPIDGK